MKVFSKSLDMICTLITKYFLIWCPKKPEKDCGSVPCNGTEYEQYIKYYSTGTRWI